MSSDWLSQVVQATLEASEPSRLDAFLREPRWGSALEVWLDDDPLDRTSLDAILSRLLRDVAEIDRLLNAQVNALLHHPKFQRLEAAWRGLLWMVDSVPHDAAVKVRILNASWMDIAKDAERAIEFDQSVLFKKIYSAEFGTPGGQPFGLLLGDYYLSHRPRPDQRTDDLRVLRSVATVAAAAFCPFVTSAHASLLGYDSFESLQGHVDLERTFRGVEYTAWRSLRDSEEMRFVGLTMPSMLVRHPYRYNPRRGDGFRFKERAVEHGEYLWGNACFAFGRVVIRAFAKWGWLADIRGTKRDEECGGLVTHLCAPDYGTDSPGVARRFPTEVFLTDRTERQLSERGFIPLSAVAGEDLAVFYSTSSLHSVRAYDTEDATLNARLSSLMHYVLCVSRIAHYIKVLCRDLTGTYSTARDIQKHIKDWLMSITATTENASDELQARFPLRESDVSVRELPGRPGCYDSIIHLCPHFQLDQMTSSMRLVTEIATTR